MEAPPALLARLTRVLARTPPEHTLAMRLCQAVVELLGLSGGSITVGFSPPDRTTLCATDSLAERIEDLQDVLREGPGLDAFRSRSPVRLTSSEQREHWPMLTRAFDDADEGSPALLLAVPMRPDSKVLGVLTLFSRATEAVGVDLDEAQFLADAVGIAILGEFERSDSTEELWMTRDRINQATGMVVAQIRVQPADALAVLRAHAFAHDMSMAEVAEAVVSRDLDFRPPTAGESRDD